jgi:lysophospholipase L1-like esterase
VTVWERRARRGATVGLSVIGALSLGLGLSLGLFGIGTAGASARAASVSVAKFVAPRVPGTRHADLGGTGLGSGAGTDPDHLGPAERLGRLVGASRINAYSDPGDDGVSDGTDLYVVLGGSISVGEQPTVISPRGAPTDQGYANDLLATERSRWNDLELVHLGCPGETTSMMLYGGAHCPYLLGSQLAEAESFLRQHPGTVLSTIDLGFNDVRPCMLHEVLNQVCADAAIAEVRTQMPEILARLRAADPAAKLVGVGHYDPYLAYYLDGPTGQAFAEATLGVINRLNATLRAVYAAADVPMADVASGFDLNDTTPTPLAGFGDVPRNVERVCTLTWMCVAAPSGPNVHPNEAGYQVISEAIADVITSG